MPTDDRDDRLFKIMRLPTVSLSCHQPCGLEWQPHDAKLQSVSVTFQSASSTLLRCLSDPVVLAGLGVASELQLVGLALVYFHVLPLEIVVLGHLL